MQRRFSTNVDEESYDNEFLEINKLLSNKINILNNDIEKFNYFIKRSAIYYANCLSKSYNNPAFLQKIYYGKS